MCFCERGHTGLMRMECVVWEGGTAAYGCVFYERGHKGFMCMECVNLLGKKHSSIAQFSSCERMHRGRVWLRHMFRCTHMCVCAIFTARASGLRLHNRLLLTVGIQHRCVHLNVYACACACMCMSRSLFLCVCHACWQCLQVTVGAALPESCSKQPRN